jgi:hypothetical protein
VLLNKHYYSEQVNDDEIRACISTDTIQQDNLKRKHLYGNRREAYSKIDLEVVAYEDVNAIQGE